MLPALLDHLRLNRDFIANVVAWERIPPRAARTAPLPEWLDPRIAAALHGRGIDALYSHQAAAVEAARQGQNVDMIFTGHFHTTCAFKFGYGNGSPVGYSEYAHSLRLDPEPPQQWLVYAHPTRGITHDWKLRLDDEYRANQAKRL